MLYKSSALFALIASCLLLLASAGGGTISNSDKANLGGYFSGRVAGGFGWTDFVITNNYLTFTAADGTKGAVVWGELFPRLLIAHFNAFNSSNPTANLVAKRTGYAFFGAASIYGALGSGASGYSGIGEIFWNLNASDVTVGTVAMKNLTYTRSFQITNTHTNTVKAVTFVVENLIVKAAGTVTVNGVSYNAKAGDVKSTYRVTDWPFDTTTGTSEKALYLAIYINSDGKGVQNSTVSTVGATFGIGNGVLVTPTTATVDGTTQNINITAIVDDDGTGGSGQVRELVVLSFPSFTNEVDYDPINSMGGNGASALTVSLMMIFALILALVNLL